MRFICKIGIHKFPEKYKTYRCDLNLDQKRSAIDLEVKSCRYCDKLKSKYFRIVKGYNPIEPNYPWRNGNAKGENKES